MFGCVWFWPAFPAAIHALAQANAHRKLLDDCCAFFIGQKRLWYAQKPPGGPLRKKNPLVQEETRGLSLQVVHCIAAPLAILRQKVAGAHSGNLARLSVAVPQMRPVPAPPL
jgi:hypothetical protein